GRSVLPNGMWMKSTRLCTRCPVSIGHAICQRVTGEPHRQMPTCFSRASPFFFNSRTRAPAAAQRSTTSVPQSVVESDSSRHADAPLNPTTPVMTVIKPEPPEYSVDSRSRGRLPSLDVLALVVYDLRQERVPRGRES